MVPLTPVWYCRHPSTPLLTAPHSIWVIFILKALSKLPVVMKVMEVGEFPDPASMYMWWPVLRPQMIGTGAPPVTTNLEQT